MMAVVRDENLSAVFRLLRERAGIDADACGVESIAHVVRQRASASGAGSTEEYVRSLALDPAAFQELLEDAVVPETWFFRDNLAFRAVQHYLEACHPGNRKGLRCLSVACSTGEEAYSLAMALRSANIEPSEFCIVGTDVSNRALDLARKGDFSTRSFRDPDTQFVALCKQWCDRTGESWRVRDDLRQGVEFRWGNLAEPGFLAGEPPFDVVFCRNLLIYFHAEARRMAVRHLDRLLSPGGLLCCAAAEARIFSEAGFCSVAAEYPVAFRRQDKVDFPAAAAMTRQRCADARQPFLGTVSSASPTPRRADADCALAAAKRANLGAADVHSPIAVADATGVETSSVSLLLAAQQAADSGRLDVAENVCAQVLTLEPGSAEAHYLRGVVRQAQGMFDEAQESLERALYLDPRHYQALVHMTLLAERRGDRRLASNYRRRASQSKPTEAK
jgi:chemotaxis protein methyltransferase WspC